MNLQIMNGSKKERKEVLLEEHDPIWVELRDLFIADVRNFGSSDSLQCFLEHKLYVCVWSWGWNSQIEKLCVVNAGTGKLASVG